MKWRNLLTLCVLALACACGKSPDNPAPSSDSFVKGADISWVTEMESRGYRFYNAAGQERECTALLQEIGFDAVRLRVWVEPQGGWNGLDDVVVKAKRAQALGMKVLIDFHYSDSWADPGQQTVPVSWQGMDAVQTATMIRAHTQTVLTALLAAGVKVSWVQVGNEVTNGMLWESGRVAGDSAGEFVQYFHVGREAVKAVYPQAQVILHLDNGWDLDLLNGFLTLMKGAGLQYDILGLSLYPSYWQDGSYPDWRPKVERFIGNLPRLYGNFGKRLMLVEFGMPAGEPDKAKAALQYLMDHTKDLGCFDGIFWWEPEAEHARNGYDYGAFADGKPTAALKPFGE